MSAAARKAAEPDSLPTVAEFENGTLDPTTFDHRAHVYIAWALLDESPLLGAIRRYSEALRRWTASLGIPDKYHETVTWLFVILIAERKSAGGPQSWREFAAANPDILAGGRCVLERFYSPGRLWSSSARQQFLLPDRLPAR